MRPNPLRVRADTVMVLTTVIISIFIGNKIIELLDEGNTTILTFGILVQVIIIVHHIMIVVRDHSSKQLSSSSSSSSSSLAHSLTDNNSSMSSSSISTETSTLSEEDDDSSINSSSALKQEAIDLFNARLFNQPYTTRPRR